MRGEPAEARRPGPSWPSQLALGATTAALSGFTLRRETGPHDEGLMLQAAARLARGQRPYRDFRLNYPPGQPLVLAGLHRVIGPSLMGWRVVRVGVDTTTSLLAYRLARREASRPLGLAAWLGTAGAMAFPTVAGPNPPAQALALGALLAAPQRPRRAAILAGLATAFRIEVGVGTTLGVGLAAPSGRRLQAAGTGLLTALAALAPFAAAAPQEMFEDTLGFFAIQRMQRLPWPLRFEGPWRPSKLIEFYAPAISVASLALWLAAVGTRPRDHPRETWAAGPLAAVGAGYLLARTDEFHLIPLMATLPAMLATAASHEQRAPVRAALVAALALNVAHGMDRKAGMALHPPPLAPVPGAAGHGVNTSPSDAATLAQLISTVHTLTAPGEPIFVANPRHDLIRVGNPLLYTLLDRPNATRYDVMQPGVVTTQKVQEEIVGDLARVRVIVRWLNPTACAPEPNGAGHSSGVEILDAHISEHFVERARFGDYQVLARPPSDS